MTHQLVVKEVVKTFEVADGRLSVLAGVSFEMSGGDTMAIVGPSGSGKSTLLQIIGTLDQPDSGSVTIDQTDPSTLRETELAKFRNQSVGFIFQDHHLLPQLNVLENVLVPALAFGKPSKTQLDSANRLVDAVGLADRRDHLPSELSGGQRERVAIARALVMNPSVILADEPTGNLDRRTADEMTELLLSLQKETGSILITVTHSESLAAAMDQQKELIDGNLN